MTDRRCFDRIMAVVESSNKKSFTATECRLCVWGRCTGGVSTIRRSYHTDLQVVR